VNQDPKYHQEGTVFDHVERCVEQFYGLKSRSKDVNVFIATILHDVGKYEKTQKKNGRIHHIGHELESEKLVQELLIHSDLQLLDRMIITALVRYHDVFFGLDEIVNKEMFCVQYDMLTYNHFNDLRLLALIDNMGRIGEGTEDMINQLESLFVTHTLNDVYELGWLNRLTSYQRMLLHQGKLPYEHYKLDSDYTSDNEVILMSGLPGSGKSTYAQKLLEDTSNCEYLSFDAMRKEYDIIPGDWKTEKEVDIEGKARQLLKQHVKDGKSVIIDNLNVSYKTRQKWLKIKK